MQDINVRLLQMVDRLNRQVVFLNTAIDKMVGWMMPKKATALAANCYYCATGCYSFLCTGGDKGKIADFYTYAPYCNGQPCAFVDLTGCEYC